MSPKYKPPNLREEFMETAVQQAVSLGLVKGIDQSSVSLLNQTADIYERPQDLNLTLQKSFYENRKVQDIANKLWSI